MSGTDTKTKRDDAIVSQDEFGQFTVTCARCQIVLADRLPTIRDVYYSAGKVLEHQCPTTQADHH